MDQDKVQIEAIVYLAGLASAKDIIDTKMDILRRVTSQMQPDAPLSESDRAELKTLEQDLRSYLVHDDPLRNFTAQSLEERVQSHLAPAKPRARPFWHLAALSALAPLAVFAIPPYQLSSARMLFAVSVYFTAISTQIVLVYHSALRNFKPALRQVIVYQYLAAIALVLAFSVYIALEAFGWYKLPLFRYGGLPYAGGVALILLYISMRKYAAVVGRTTRYASVLLLLGVLVAVVLAGVFVPLIKDVPHPALLRTSMTGMFVLGTFAAFGAGLARSVLHAVTPAYSKSLWVTYLFLLLVAVCGPLFGVYLYVVGELVAAQLSFAMLPLAGPPMLILLYAAYSFRKETNH